LVQKEAEPVPADGPEPVADPAPVADRVTEAPQDVVAEDKEAEPAKAERQEETRSEGNASPPERKLTVAASAELAVSQAVDASGEAITAANNEPEQAEQPDTEAVQPDGAGGEAVVASDDDTEGKGPAEPERTAKVISLEDRRAAKQQEAGGNGGDDGGNGDDGDEGGEGEGPERPNQQVLLRTLDEITHGPGGSPFGIQPEELAPGEIPSTAVGGRVLETTVEVYGESVEVEIIKNGEHSQELAAGIRRHGEIVHAASVGVGFGSETLQDQADRSERRDVEIFAEIPENGPTLWTVSAVSADKRNTLGVRRILEDLGFQDLTFARAGKVARFKLHEPVSEDRAQRLAAFLQRHLGSTPDQGDEDV
jgi:hypothetical protein